MIGASRNRRGVVSTHVDVAVHGHSALGEIGVSSEVKLPRLGHRLKVKSSDQFMIQIQIADVNISIDLRRIDCA